MMRNFTITLNALLLLTIPIHLTCSATTGRMYGSGETFAVLAYPEGIGTLLFFYIEADPMSEKIRFDVAMLSEKYNNLRVVFIDANKKRNLLLRHQVFELPSILLFDKMGTEFYRWLPTDFDDDFSRRDLERLVDKLPG